MNRRKYVALRAVGGLGNQLFQYAAGRALAHRIGARLVIDCSNYLNPSPDRPFSLDSFKVDAELIWRPLRQGPHGNTILPLRVRSETINHLLARRWIANRLSHRLANYHQAVHGYDPHFETLASATFLSGYWTSHRYFEAIEGHIRRELQHRSEPRGPNRQWLDRIAKSNSVCVHVRRGDYLNAAQLEHHGLCSPAYYQRAIGEVQSRTADTTIFVFSEDLAWCRDNLSLAKAHFVDANGPEAPVEELRLMMSCRHHVIANSTFSWWAAWLAGHAGQIVVAPFPWWEFTGGADLLPNNWLLAPRS